MSQIDTKTNTHLTSRQIKAIQALQSGANFNEAARAAGVTRNTLYRWRQDPEFVAVLAAKDTQRLDDAKRQLIGVMEDMITICRDIAEDESASRRVRLQAIRLIMDQSSKLVEQVDIIERIKAIEEALNERVR